jgi:histidinol-phosphate/aromatic aminotransferase/cobyric acid decarboxylase-like protein
VSTPHLGFPAPGPHGGDVERIALSIGVDPDSLLDLSASLNPVGPDVMAMAAGHLPSLRRYPDARGARAVLSNAIGVEPDRLLLTNGGAEAISLLAQEIGGHVREPEFSLHPRGQAEGPRWRSNPHNPTGLLAGPGEAADVWDEAFYPLAAGRWTLGDEGAIAVVGSLTKVFACPGLRLGYAIADPDLIRQLERRQAEWSVGGLALALVPKLLECADLSGWAREIALLRTELVEILVHHGVHPQPSDANFVLCDAPSAFRERLLSHGVVVRDCASFGLEGWVRIAVPDREGLERLSAALDAMHA